MKTLISGGTVIPLDGGDAILTETDVYVSDGKIVAVGTTGTPFPEGEADRTVDARSKIVMPGLINTHTHIGMTYIRGLADDVDLHGFFANIVPPLRLLKRDDIYWATLLGVAEMLRAGVTTFADMGNDMDATAQAVERSGIRASLASEIFSKWIRVDMGFDETPRRFDMTFRAGVDFAARWQGAAAGRIITMLAPHSTYSCHPLALERVAQIAKETNQQICIHVSETKEQVEESFEKYGRSPVAVLADSGILEQHVLGAHCIHLSDADIEAVSRADFHVAHCPQCNLKIALGVARVPYMLEKGINVTLGTDSTSSNNNLDMFEELRLASLIHKQMEGDPTILPAQQVLRMATSNGAKALGLSRDVGTIEVGKKADVIILDTSGPHMHPQNSIISNLVYASSSRDVHTVMVDGEVVMEGREILTFDEEEVIREADRRMASLRSRL